ncbi:MAG: HAMP domain-containing histidine kinase, partial [Bacteroidales bacterium]|nr:HAMP domain-containing histidine kinase [Bacteroidales bacterium]
WDFYEKKGLFGGKITRGYEQGKHVAKLVEKIIDGNLPDSTKQFSFVENNYVFDYQELLKFEISKNQLPAGSTIINEPDKDKDVLKVTIAVIILLWLMVMVLAVRLKIRKARAAELEKLVMERTALLNKTNDELANVIMNKDKFFSLLAHDLRNLVGAFLNCMQIINSESLTLGKEKTKKLSLRAQEVANQTYELLEDLLYWGIRQFRGEQKQTLNISSFSIEEVFNTIIEKYKVNCANINVITQVEDGLMLESDRDICKFIFRNILVNAIKFSKEGGNIYIKGYTHDNNVSVIIQDEGIGMSTDIIESIYNKAPIRKNAGKGKESTGLGLPSALDYLEMIQGVLLIESEPGEGSTFTIEFPKAFE